MRFVPGMERVMDGSELRSITLGHPLVDAYLECSLAPAVR